MKFFHVILFSISLLLYSCSCSQIQPTAISNYSYFAIGISSFHPYKEVGTAFFVKNKNDYYLVSASHMFNCVDVFKKAFYPLDSQWESVVIRYADSTHPNSFSPPISIVELKAKTIPFNYYDSADLICFKIDPPKGYKIYSIENFIPPNYTSNDAVDSIFLYGYKTPDQPNLDPAHPALADTVTSTYYSGVISQNGKYYYHSNGLSQILDTLNYICTPHPWRGQSGSPVFFKLKNCKKIVFGGLAFGGNYDENIGFIIRPEVVVKYVESVCNCKIH